MYGNAFAPLEFELDDGPAIEQLLSAYPHPIMISDLYHPSEELEDKVSLAEALFKEGFLMIVDDTSKPVQQVEYDDDHDHDHEEVMEEVGEEEETNDKNQSIKKENKNEKHQQKKKKKLTLL
jgi:hypothetical protein